MSLVQASRFGFRKGGAIRLFFLVYVRFAFYPAGFSYNGKQKMKQIRKNDRQYYDADAVQKIIFDIDVVSFEKHNE